MGGRERRWGLGMERPRHVERLAVGKRARRRACEWSSLQPRRVASMGGTLGVRTKQVEAPAGRGWCSQRGRALDAACACGRPPSRSSTPARQTLHHARKSPRGMPHEERPPHDTCRACPWWRFGCRMDVASPSGQWELQPAGGGTWQSWRNLVKISFPSSQHTRERQGACFLLGIRPHKQVGTFFQARPD